MTNKSKHPDDSSEIVNQKLREYADRYLRLQKLSNNGVLVVQDSSIKECNPSMVALCGYGLEELLDTDFASFFHLEDISSIKSACRQSLIDEKNVQKQPARIIRKDGKQVDTHISIDCCTYHEKAANLIVVKDLSTQLKAQRDIEKAGKFESIAALSGGIAHDYNNILTAIIGNISLAQACLKPDDKAYLLLKQALAASMTAKSLTQTLISFSTGGAPEMKIARIAKVVKGAIEFSLSGSNIKCDYNLSDDLWPVKIDPTQIGQAVYNVVMNAREAMPEGGSLQVATENLAVDQGFLSLAPGGYIKISITDQGDGIPAEDYTRIFEPYYSTKKSENRKVAGLGLSICRSIIKQHGGNVDVDSEIGIGTTIHLYLPAAGGDHLERLTTIDPVSEEIIFGEGKILVMDDDKFIRDLAGELLAHLGYNVSFAEDGNEAVAQYRNALQTGTPFDAVILDLTVRGGMGGKEAIQILKEIDPGVVGIVSSGYSEDPGLTDFNSFGFKGVVAKPYTIEELSIKLKQVLLGKENSDIPEK